MVNATSALSCALFAFVSVLCNDYEYIFHIHIIHVYSATATRLSYDIARENERLRRTETRLPKIILLTFLRQTDHATTTSYTLIFNMSDWIRTIAASCYKKWIINYEDVKWIPRQSSGKIQFSECEREWVGSLRFFDALDIFAVCIYFVNRAGFWFYLYLLNYL